MVLPATNQVLQLNSVACSESVFTAEIVFSIANHCLLPKWCCLQRIRVHCQNCVVCTEEVFVAEIMLAATNQVLLPNGVAFSELVFFIELCCPQRIRIHYKNYVICSE